MITENKLERTRQLSKARKVLTAFVILFVMPFVCFLLLSREASDEALTSITPTATPAPTPTELSELVIVEYQIEVVSEATSELVEFWYTSESSGKNQTESMRLRNTKPFTKTVTIYPGEYVEIAGVLANGKFGELTCRILVNDLLIEQSTSKGAGTSVYCSSFALTR